MKEKELKSYLLSFFPAPNQGKISKKLRVPERDQWLEKLCSCLSWTSFCLQHNAFLTGSVHSKAHYQLQTFIQQHMGGFLASISCPQRIHSFCVLVDCVIAQLESPQDKLFKAEHFQLLWSDSSRFLSEDSRAMWHTAARAVSEKQVVRVHSSKVQWTAISTRRMKMNGPYT